MVTFAPIIGLSANTFTQILCARIFKPHIARAIICGFVCGFAILAIAVAFNISLPMPAGPLIGLWLTSGATYIALSFGFWAFLNLNMTSLRIRVLREILHADGRITRAELLRRYSPDEFLRRRLARLRHFGQLRFQDGRYYLGSRKLLYVSYCLDALRALVLPGISRNMRRTKSSF